MLAAPSRPRFSFEDYVDLEECSTVRHEFLDGDVWAMAGGSPDHAALAVNVSSALRGQLRGRPCRVYSSDLRVRVLSTGLATYPDVAVVCTGLQFDPADRKRQTVINPLVIVEILSPTTEQYDRTEKLEHYKKIESLKDIVLVAHNQRRIEVWHREGDGDWALDVRDDHGDIAVRAVDCHLSLDDVYDDPLSA